MLDRFQETWLFDLGPIEAVQEFFGTGHPAPFRAISLLGDTWGMLLVVGLALWWWGRRPAYAVLAAIALGAGFKQMLSISFPIDRPIGEGTRIRVYHEIEISSFPSGHVLQTVVPWGVLSLRGLAPWAVTAALVLAMCVARLYLGLHFLADVVFGVAFGLLFLALFHPAWRRLEPWLAGRSLRFWTGVGLVLILGLVGNLLLTEAGGNPRRWEILGLVGGGTVGLTAERRFVGYAPAEASWRQRLVTGLVGVLGLAACFGLDRLVGREVLWVGLVSAGLAMLWVTLLAPWLFTHLGWGTHLRTG